MLKQIKIYVTSKREHADKILKSIPDGFHCNARWPYMLHTGVRPVNHWLRENYDDAIASHFVIFYVEAADELNVSLLELGNACAYDKQIFVATDRIIEDEILPHKKLKNWVGLDNVKITGTLEQTYKYIRRQVEAPTRLWHTGLTETQQAMADRNSKNMRTE